LSFPPFFPAIAREQLHPPFFFLFLKDLKKKVVDAASQLKFVPGGLCGFSKPRTGAFFFFYVSEKNTLKGGQAKLGVSPLGIGENKCHA
jgi:hypothetical protein